jgi:hypothetical protein
VRGRDAEVVEMGEFHEHVEMIDRLEEVGGRDVDVGGCVHDV